MKNKVVVYINAPQRQVATLFADPSNTTKWMDVARYEPVSGKQGTPGSKYVLIPKRGSAWVTATVVERSLPKVLRVNLESSSVSVDLRGTLSTLPDGRTRLESEEQVRFKGVWRRALGVFARPAINKAHRRQIQAFKQFVEKESKLEPVTTRRVTRKSVMDDWMS